MFSQGYLRKIKKVTQSGPGLFFFNFDWIFSDKIPGKRFTVANREGGAIKRAAVNRFPEKTKKTGRGPNV